jgi:hypothetical protein
VERFILEIDIGNDGMQGGPDIAEALKELARRIENGSTLDCGYIHDYNGNKVGSHHVTIEVE